MHQTRWYPQKIKEKTPWLQTAEIIVQHDGASPHASNGNESELNAKGLEEGWSIRFETQPAQSPDLNKNDLCLFSSLQSQAN